MIWVRCSYSLLPAITVDGLIYTHVKIGGYNGEQFVDWLEGLLEVMNPYPAPRSVLIIDNCRIHHVEEVEEMCNAKSVSSPRKLVILVVMDILVQHHRKPSSKKWLRLGPSNFSLLPLISPRRKLP
jgi:transposase